ncbi:MAG TPA: HAMP domain-containing sensor histidine kinase [Burkholderiales bacterium]|nr:HAMP domain-containing sensor histidine kinase [Burkholderiales bacterium]
MAAGVAHEIRNPLGVMSSAVGLLKEARVSADERREVVELLEREVNRLNHIVSDTLTLAHTRISERRPLVLEPLIREVLDSLALRYGDVGVESAIAPDLPLVTGDPLQVEQVIWNLTENALAAIKGSGRLSVSAFAQDSMVVLRVADTGCGMTADIREKVFQPFFTTRPGGQASG